jgi:hypothetical protein
MAAPLNIIVKVLNKLTQIYTFTISRIAKNASDQPLIDFLVKHLEIDGFMGVANNLVNGMRCSLVQLYQKEDYTLGMRIIPASRFYVYSTSLVDPTKPNVYVLFMGNTKSINNPKKKTSLFFFYTDTEFYAVDGEGKIRNEHMPDGPVNKLGFAPFEYINKDVFDLHPEPNYDFLQLCLQPSVVYTDAIVANYYQSFPVRILTGADLESSHIDMNPHSIVTLVADRSSPNQPTLTEMASTLDTSKSTGLADRIIELIYSIYDIESSGSDGGTASSESGIALSIKSSSLVENRKNQIEIFRPRENSLWKKIAKFHNIIIKNNTPDLPKDYPKQQFTEDFNIAVEFPLPDTTVEQKQTAQEDKEEVTDESSNIEDN